MTQIAGAVLVKQCLIMQINPSTLMKQASARARATSAMCARPCCPLP